MTLPLQPVELDPDGRARFVPNALVRLLVDSYGLNALADQSIGTPQEWTQLASLIGYSVDGFSELSYVTKADIRRADRKAHRLR